MKIKYIEKTQKNCDNSINCKNNHDCKDCKEFTLMAELIELAHECEYDKIEIIPKKTNTEKKEELLSQYLYKTDVEDWNDEHRPIWKLNQKLTMYEWGNIKRYFKYYRNRNLTGWGTTSPEEVTRILRSIHN